MGAGSGAACVRFHRDQLGLRLVKRTVNFDDPTAWHLYFGDRVGSPGTILTHFCWPGRLARGRAGAGQANAIRLAIPVGSLARWRARLGESVMGEGALDGAALLRVRDPDGLELDLVEDGSDMRPGWEAGGADAIRGIHSVVVGVQEPARSAEFMNRFLGLPATVIGDGMRLGQGPGVGVDFVKHGQPGRFGAGAVHHVAWRIANAGQQEELRARLVEAGVHVSPVLDRQYFESIYFREPGGLLCEVATDAPGFTVDEPEATLGTELRLPAQYEEHRAHISAALPALEEVAR
jgi:glyoxalase family protein